MDDGWMEGWMYESKWPILLAKSALNLATILKAQARQIHVMWAPRAKRFDDQASSPEMEVSRDPQKWSSFKCSILELSILVSVVGVLLKRHPEWRVIVASKPFNNTGMYLLWFNLLNRRLGTLQELWTIKWGVTFAKRIQQIKKWWSPLNVNNIMASLLTYRKQGITSNGE